MQVPQKLHSVAADYAENCTAMLEAAAMGRSQLLKLEELLVKKHCNANFVNGEGFCALHSATFNGHLLTVKMLMRYVCPCPFLFKCTRRSRWSLPNRHHAKVNLPSTNPDYIGWTALHFAACSSDDLELIQYLLLNGADPTAKTADGDTPYSLAVVTGKPEAVTQKLLGGDLLQAELKKLGLFQRLQPILQANAIDTIDDLNDLTLTELMSLQDKGGATKITREEALQIWKCRHPVETMLAFGAIKLLLGLIAIWIFLHVVQFLLGVSIIS